MRGVINKGKIPAAKLGHLVTFALSSCATTVTYGEYQNHGCCCLTSQHNEDMFEYVKVGTRYGHDGYTG